LKGFEGALRQTRRVDSPESPFPHKATGSWPRPHTQRATNVPVKDKSASRRESCAVMLDPAKSRASSKSDSKLFVVDADARLFKGKNKLSLGEQSLYMTMRSLADGQTGELAINGHALDWRYICREAQISRCTWLKRRRGLIAAGLLYEHRERVAYFDHKVGRLRTVLAETHYFIRRQADAGKTTKNSMILLKSTSSTVEEVDPQIIQTHPEPYGAVPAVAVDPVVEPALETHISQSSSPAESKPDDDRESNPLQEKSDREIQGRDTAVSNWMKANDLKDPVWAEAAIVHINDPDRRKTWTPHDPYAYWTKCLANLTPEDIEKIREQANLLFDLRQNVDNAVPAPEVLEAYARGEINEEQAGLHNWYSCEINDCAQCKARSKACWTDAGNQFGLESDDEHIEF
jgi:hypothetical protein